MISVMLVFNHKKDAIKGILKYRGKGKWCVAKYGDPYSEFVLCI